MIAAYVSLEQVMFPLLAKAQANADHYKSLFNNFTKLSSLFFLGLVLILFQDVILSFFPLEYQLPHLFNLLIIWACSLIIINPLDIISYSLNLTRKHFRWVIVYSLFQVVIMLFSLQKSLTVMLISLIVFNLVMYLISFEVLFRADRRLSQVDWSRPLRFFLVMIVAIMVASQLPLIASSFFFAIAFLVLHRLMYH